MSCIGVEWIRVSEYPFRLVEYSIWQLEQVGTMDKDSAGFIMKLRILILFCK